METKQAKTNILKPFKYIAVGQIFVVSTSLQSWLTVECIGKTSKLAAYASVNKAYCDDIMMIDHSWVNVYNKFYLKCILLFDHF